MGTSQRIMLILLLIGGSVTGIQTQDISGSRYFFFVSDQRVVTLELSSTQKGILNYFNLGDTFEMLRAPALLIGDRDGGTYRGHVLRVEEPSSRLEQFKVSELIAPRKYGGFEVMGDFRLRAPAQRALLRLGARFVELEPISRSDFDRMAARIPHLDLSLTEGKEIVMRAGFRKGFGEVHILGSEMAEQLVLLFPDADVLPPVLLEGPKPLLPSALSSFPDPVTVVLTGLVNRSGGVSQLEVLEGLDQRLDSLAMETVRNSWIFLPAISGDRVVDAELELVVAFRRN